MVEVRGAPATSLEPRARRGRRPGRRPHQPRLHRRPRAPDPGRAGAAALRPVRARDPRGVPRRDQGVRRREPRAGVDPRRRLGDAGLPRWHPDRGRPRLGGPRPAGVLPQPRPSRRLGQLACPRARRHRPRHARPRRRPHRARRRRPPGRHAPRGRDVAGVAARAPHERRGLLRRPVGGPALPPLRRRDGMAGRHRRLVRRHGRPRRDVRQGRGQRRPALPRGRRAVVGAAARHRAGRGPRRPPRGAQRRALPGGERSR